MHLHEEQHSLPQAQCEAGSRLGMVQALLCAEEEDKEAHAEPRDGRLQQEDFRRPDRVCREEDFKSQRQTAVYQDHDQLDLWNLRNLIFSDIQPIYCTKYHKNRKILQFKCCKIHL